MAPANKRGSQPGPAASARTKKAAATRAEQRRQQAVAAAPRPEHSEHEPGAWIRVSDIFIDPAYVGIAGIEGYQREQNQARIRMMAENFNPDYFGILTVSERKPDEYGPNGERYACIDGGHRLGIFRYLGWTEDLVPCDVYTGISIYEEARIFVAMNKDRVRVLPMQIFMGKYSGNDQDAIALYDAITASGLALSKHGGQQAGTFRAISEAERVQRVAGTDVVYAAMYACHKAFGEDPNGISGKVFTGVAYILFHFGRLVDSNRLIMKLSEQSQEKILHNARMLRQLGGSGQMVAHIATAMVMEYNKNMRTRRLPDVPRTGWRRGAYSPDATSTFHRKAQTVPHWETENGIPSTSEVPEVLTDPPETTR